MQQESASKPKLFSPKKPCVGVFCGGRSSERKISLRSGRAIGLALRRSGYKVCYLDPARPAELQGRVKKIHVAFLALHGRGGEDGSIQAWLDQRKIPYTGSGTQASRSAFDKELTKKILRRKRIPTAEYRVLYHRQSGNGLEKRIRDFQAPFFVKPPQEGSSIGIFQVRSMDGAVPRVRTALRKFRRLMIERAIDGPEYTVGVLGNRALSVIELRPRCEFYDYHAKYTKGMTEYLVPAPVSSDLKKQLQRLALRVHRVLGMRDLSRVDFKVDAQTGKPYVLEVNSIPGFTEFSLVPKAAACDGISFEDLCEKLVGFAVRRSYRKG